MATGSIVIFEQFYLDEALKKHNLDADDIFLALIDNTLVPTAATANPTWGAAGTTNLSTYEVSPGTGYTTGGINISSTAGLSAGTLVFDGDVNPTWAKTAGGPPDIYYGVIYNNTHADKPCIAFIDMGGPVSIDAGQVSVTWSGSGIMTKGAA